MGNCNAIIHRLHFLLLEIVQWIQKSTHPHLRDIHIACIVVISTLACVDIVKFLMNDDDDDDDDGDDDDL